MGCGPDRSEGESWMKRRIEEGVRGEGEVTLILYTGGGEGEVTLILYTGIYGC